MADPASRRARPEPAAILADPDEALATLALTLHDAAGLVGAYRWTEERLFAVTGRWSADPAMDPEAQVHLFEASAQHAWHADLWGHRLPVLDGFDPEAATRPRGPVLEPLLAALDDEAEPAARLAGIARVVLPELAAAYRRHLARTVPVTDGPVIRTLHLVLADLDAEEAALERVLLRPWRDPGTSGGEAPEGAVAAAADAAVRRLEAVLEGAADPTEPGPSSTGPRPVRLVPWPGEGR